MGKIPPQKRPHNRPVWYVQKSITSPTLVTINLLTRPLANFILEVEHDNKEENLREKCKGHKSSLRIILPC
jgi:hypothetical protein